MSTETYGFRRRWAQLNAAAGATDTYIMPTDYDQASVTVHPGAGGTAKLEISCAAPAAIDAGNGDWVEISFDGTTDVNGDEGTEISPAVTALRLSATTAAAKANVALINTRSR